MNEDDRANAVILKVNARTRSSALKSAILGNICHSNVYIDSIGAIPNYITVKAIITARAYLSACGKSLEAIPFYHDINIDKPVDGIAVKTGIRWILKQKEN